LQTAVKYGHVDIVSILISYGAEAGAALPGAVADDCRTTVQAYLECDGLEILVRGICSEDKVLFSFLVEYTLLSPPTRRREYWKDTSSTKLEAATANTLSSLLFF
jgi:hypothetical protein